MNIVRPKLLFPWWLIPACLVIFFCIYGLLMVVKPSNITVQTEYEQDDYWGRRVKRANKDIKKFTDFIRK